jgi:hypothetical protein
VLRIAINGSWGRDVSETAGIAVDDGLVEVETAGVEPDNGTGCVGRTGNSVAVVLRLLPGAWTVVPGIAVRVMSGCLQIGNKKRWLRVDVMPDANRIMYARG